MSKNEEIVGGDIVPPEDYIDTKNTIIPICPYCGHEDWKWSELDIGASWTTCDKCKKDYEISIKVAYSFTTWKETEDLDDDKEVDSYSD